MTKAGSQYNSITKVDSNNPAVQKSPSNYNSIKGDTKANVQLKVQPITINKVQPTNNLNTTMNNQGNVTPNQHPDEDDNLINEEILRNTKNQKDDEMYEGGEEDGVSDANENYRVGNDDKELEGD